MDLQTTTKDMIVAARLAITSASGRHFLRNWFLIPAGIMPMLAACFGVDVLFKRLSVSFPASVACLVLLFLGLLACEAVLGGHRTRRVVSIIDVPAGWSLRWINVFFTPAFVMLPLSPPIGIKEVLKMIGVFVIGFFIMMILAAYLTRGLQLILGFSKKAHVQRAEELGEDTDDIPLRNRTAFVSNEGSRATSMSQVAPSFDSLQQSSYSNSSPGLPPTPQDSVQHPPQVRPHNGNIQCRMEPLEFHHEDTPPILLERPQQAPVPLSRAEKWAAIGTANIDSLLFVVLFLLVGLPVYYAADYAMPLHLTVSILTYFAAMALPATWRQYLHPVLVSSLLTVLFIWALASIKQDSLSTALKDYRTGANYLLLWEQAGHLGHHLPGAGDLFATVLDASIVSLALPMFQYRRELKEHYLSIIVPNVLISIGSLFSYPPLCFAIGISAERSLAFASRSLTLALATPATKNLGGDVNTVAALAIVSGILGVLVGQRILDWLKIPEDDYVTRGVTLGVNSSAIATALLLRTDPRAASLSSLSMSLFGTVTVLFTSIPPVVNMIRSLVGF